MAGSSERQMVLKMLSEGRIGAEEAEELLAALDRAVRGGERPGERGPGRPDRAERPTGDGDQPDLDFGEIGRGIREAVRGLGEGLEKLTRTMPWGRDLGEWFKSALGGAKITVERPIVCPADAALDRVTVKASNGSVRLRGTKTARPTGRAIITAWGGDETTARALAEEIRVFTSTRDGVLEISSQTAATGEGAAPERFQVDLDLEIPELTTLTVGTTAGAIDVADLAGELTLTTSSGSVQLSRIRGAVSVVTASGGVKGDQSGADRLEVKSSSGDVVLTLAPSPGGNARISTTSGDIVLRLAPGARVRVEATTSSGEVVVRAPLKVEELGRSRFVGVQGAADGMVRLSSASGDLRIESPGA